MKQIWEENFNDLYRNFEDMQNHCAYLESENNQLQSNWNSLREWLEKNYKESHDIWYVKIINKMNELEGSDK